MPYPRIRSYVLRQGRITPSQRHALDASWSEYGLEVSDHLIDLASVFQREAPCVLEIGFGNGESLLEQVAKCPDKNFIGIEVHSPGVGHLIAEAKRLELSNLRVYQQDAVDVLSRSIPDETFDTIQIFFPDPWPKKRHHKRRLVQPTFVELLVRKLKPGGVLHCATDWENYAEQMMAVLSATRELKNSVGENVFYPTPYDLRPLTKFENRGLTLNHTIRDLVFIRSI